MTLDPVVSMARASTLVARDRRCVERLARRLGQSPHVIGMALRGVVGIFLLAMQRILDDAGAEPASLAIDDGNANAERTEISTRYDATPCQWTSQPRYLVGRFVDRRGASAQVRGHVMLEAVLADVVQQDPASRRFRTTPAPPKVLSGSSVKRPSPR